MEKNNELKKINKNPSQKNKKSEQKQPQEKREIAKENITKNEKVILKVIHYIKKACLDL